MLKPSLSSGGDHKLEGNSTNYSLPSCFPCSQNCKHIL